MSQLRILIAGGGTGGHIIPALAVARELVARYDAELLFVGTPRGMESRLVPEAGFALKLIDIGQLKNVSIFTRIRTVLDLPIAIANCRNMIRHFSPAAALGVGGYASGPAMAAAMQMGVPTMAFEPNAMPGLANRLIGKHVRAAGVNFPAAARYFRNAEVTGIPVRAEFFEIAARPAGAPHLLVFGGSQGARLFNLTLPKILRELLDGVPGLTILHQCGARHAEATQAAFAAAGADPARWTVQPFVNDMPAQFGRASLVMARSGASTVAELAAAGKPSLLVPFAAAADDHQKRNAEELVKVGGAAMLLESDLQNPGKLRDRLVELLGAPERLADMGTAARTQAHPAAAQRIAELLVSISQESA